ncbi:hypothetical protein GCM10027270_25500 [Nocardioides ginkgobilobae]
MLPEALVRYAVLSLALALAALTSACGSRIAPEQVLSAQGGAAGGAAAAGGDPLVPGADPGALGGTSGSVADGTTSSSGGTTGGAGSTGAGGSAGGPAGAAGEGDATGGARAGSCDGFENQTGITDDEIILANSSDVSGPVPGLFESARLGSAAYIAFFNSQSDICGRKLKMLELDSKTDSAADQAAYLRACAESFAAVGSVSIFDSGGARTTEECGLPDLRANILTNERYDCSTCFAAQALEPGVITDAAYQFYARQNKQATQSAAFLYLNLGGSPALARSFADTAESAGFGVKIYKGIESSEFNYAPFVQELKDEGITFVSFTGATQQAVRLADAMAQQGYKPDQFVVTQTQYGPEFAAQGGANVDGAMAPVPHPAFTGTNPQVALYTQWLQRVKPGASPTTFGLFAWSATRLFVEQAVALGGKLDRETLIESVRGVQKWTAGGLHSEMNVGGKQSFTCSTVVQLQRGEWRQISGDGYDCGKLVRTSVAR